MIKYLSKDTKDTLTLASKLGESVFEGAVILLTGDLGAGKTVFVKGLAQGLEYKGLVKSPTYTIMNIYQGDLPLIHFDLYRLQSDEEFYEIGADEYLRADNVCAIEWYVNAENAMGDEYLEVTIKDIGDNDREITLRASGDKYEKWLETIKDDINS